MFTALRHLWPPGRRVRRGLRMVALGLLGTQALVVMVLTVIDSSRKRLRPRRATFPRTEARTLPVGEGTATIYAEGTSLYADMLAAIDAARRRVLFESFIVKSDDVGQAFKRALTDAAARGVEVFVIYDGFANLVVPRRFFAFGPGVHVLRYPIFKPGMLMLDVRSSGRDHRKLLVVDGERGFVGGYNIGAAYASQWRDTHLRLDGPAVWDLENAFIDFWNLQCRPDQPTLPQQGTEHWEPRLRVHRNVPAQLIYPIRGMYLETIDRARHHILLTQPYFIPDREMVAALLAAARRGVTVRVLMPEVSNHVIADWLSRGSYGRLLGGGVEIWRYEQAMIHAKTMTVDGRWSTIGTANIDRLSLTGNYEVNVEIFDADVATQLERVFATDLTNSRQLTLADWRSRPALARAAERVLAPLAPLA
ncbi:MAG TPA: phosphatidylserine/phosphatidylglycerophosphate/cardiolipin synthase family protein [Solirubrobacteraceae bacterium]|nr:phosphatidylserine/phosphatidylglycerophosphate/cardiolipin synthase family protein [Solirubrobacteraceae bacterium]